MNPFDNVARVGKYGILEWSEYAENFQFGCVNDCLYCYAHAMNIRHRSIDQKRWHLPIIRGNKLNKGFRMRTGVIMFPTVHDIYPDNLDEAIGFLDKLLRPRNYVLIVSKARLFA